MNDLIARLRSHLPTNPGTASVGAIAVMAADLEAAASSLSQSEGRIKELEEVAIYAARDPAVVGPIQHDNDLKALRRVLRKGGVFVPSEEELAEARQLMTGEKG